MIAFIHRVSAATPTRCLKEECYSPTATGLFRTFAGDKQGAGVRAEPMRVDVVIRRNELTR
jgi:hypothetical protein